MAIITAQPRGLLTLTGHLLTQVEQADVLSHVAVTDRPGGGLVVSGADALKIIEYVQSVKGYREVLLADRQRYKGRRRKRAYEPFDAEWIRRQRNLGLPAIIPDSGYVAERDLQGLRLLLQRSKEVAGAVALLPLANWWMYGEGLTLLRAELRGADLPVALVLEHRDDPLGVLRILEGVVTLLRDGVTMLVLRCDVSAIGLIAHGALAAAYGSRTSIRHLYPMPQGSGGGGGGKPAESAFWPAGMALHYRDLLYDAVTASPDHPQWICACRVCRGGRLDRLATSSIEEVRQHSASSLLDLRNQMAGVATSDRPRWWTSRCRNAQLAHAAVDAGPVSFPCPKALNWWQQI
jgi:hypothetical protein